MKDITSIIPDLVAISSLQKSINMQTVNSLIEITKQIDKSARPKILESLDTLLQLVSEQDSKFDELVARIKSEADVHEDEKS